LLAGFATTGPGQFELSIEASKKAIALDPDHTLAYASLGFSQLHAGRVADAEATVQQTAERRLDAPDLVLQRYFIALVKSDGEGMKREVAQAKGKRGLEDWMSHVEALVLARSGQLREARRMARVAVDVAQQAGQRERAAFFEAATAVWEGFFGNAAAARRGASAALALTTGRDVTYAAAFALALSGEASRSRALAHDLEKRFPEDTSVRFSYLPSLRALFSLNAGEAATAIELLQASTRFDLAVPGVTFNGFFGGLYSVYVRGRAYLAANQPGEAAKEFQRILDHPGIVFGDPMGAMARLHLGRALALSGETAKAKAAYEDLLSLWSDADAETSLLTQARAEYARLR
jgi:tetratricopeptide (TPR) repeat protein